VGHGAAALLAGSERLERLAHLGALEVSDLDRDPLQRAAEDGQRGQQLGVAVAAHDLGRCRVGLQAEAVEHVPLHGTAHVGVGPDGAGDGADADADACPRQPLGIPPQLGIPAGGLEAERDRLGMNAVAAPGHRRVAVLEGQPMNDLDQPRDLALHDGGGVPEDDCGGGIQDVGAREPVVQPATLRPQPLGDRAKERDDVVLRLSLDLSGAVGIDLRGRRSKALPIGRGHHARLVHRLRRQELDPQPERQLALLPEDLAQLR
jgi:hypothetical protein